MSPAKRKRPSPSPAPARESNSSITATATKNITSAHKTPLLPPLPPSTNDFESINLKLITGSYDKVLHGFIASIPVKSLSISSSPVPAIQQDITLTTTFSDLFLFNAHTAPLRCLAISPPSTSRSNSNSSKCILATGAPDERINLYTLSSSVSPAPTTPSEAKAKSSTSNKHLGTLHEHTDTPTALLFTPTRSKLISAGEDSKILIFRTRDWSLMSTLKVPKPKSFANSNIGLLGNGDRRGGVNDIALHPSQKILLSVSKGDRGLRMWNLMTGRKAGFLGFTREVMGITVGSKIGGVTGDGLKVRWSPNGEQFAVAFERGVVVFGMDSQPKLRILTFPISKIHQIQYLTMPGQCLHALAVSTEDGGISFYSSTPPIKRKLAEPIKAASDKEKENGTVEAEYDVDNPVILGRIGGLEVGMVGRVKDFVILESKIPNKRSDRETGSYSTVLLAVTAGSDGTIRIWNLHIEQIEESFRGTNSDKEPPTKKPKGVDSVTPPVVVKYPQIGTLVGIYETGRRITCLTGMTVSEGWSVEDQEEEEEQEDDTEFSEDE